MSLGFRESAAILERRNGLKTPGRTVIEEIITNVTITDFPRDKPLSTAVKKKKGMDESQPPVKKRRRLDVAVSSTACSDNGPCRSQYIYGGVV